MLQKMYRLPNTMRSLAIRKAYQCSQIQRWYAKDVRFGPEVRALMLQGVDILADAVAVTMGPKVSWQDNYTDITTGYFFSSGLVMKILFVVLVPMFRGLPIVATVLLNLFFAYSTISTHYHLLIKKKYRWGMDLQIIKYCN